MRVEVHTDAQLYSRMCTWLQRLIHDGWRVLVFQDFAITRPKEKRKKKSKTTSLVLRKTKTVATFSLSWKLETPSAFSAFSPLKLLETPWAFSASSKGHVSISFSTLTCFPKWSRGHVSISFSTTTFRKAKNSWERNGNAHSVSKAH